MEIINHQPGSAYDRIKSLIMTAQLAPGAKVSKNDLVKLLGIGDTPVREAILRLNKEGLLRSVPQSGTYVSKINMDEVYQALFIRENIETIVFVDASEKISEAETRQLEKMLQIQKLYDDAEEPEIFFQLDEDFHAAFYHIADKDFVWQWMQLVNISLNRYRFLRLEVTELSRQSIIADHEELLTAVLNKPGEKIKKAVSKHLHLIDQDVSKVKARFPDYFS